MCYTKYRKPVAHCQFWRLVVPMFADPVVATIVFIALNNLPRGSGHDHRRGCLLPTRVRVEGTQNVRSGFPMCISCRCFVELGQSELGLPLSEFCPELHGFDIALTVLQRTPSLLHSIAARTAIAKFPIAFGNPLHVWNGNHIITYLSIGHWNGHSRRCGRLSSTVACGLADLVSEWGGTPAPIVKAPHRIIFSHRPCVCVALCFMHGVPGSWCALSDHYPRILQISVLLRGFPENVVNELPPIRTPLQPFPMVIRRALRGIRYLPLSPICS